MTNFPPLKVLPPRFPSIRALSLGDADLGRHLQINGPKPERRRRHVADTPA